MLKKTLAAAGVAALLILGGSSAAMAVDDDYPITVSCTAKPATIRVGQTSVVTCTGLRPNITGSLTVNGPGVSSDTLSSIVLASGHGTRTVTKTTSAKGDVSVTFRGPVAGGFSVALAAENGQTGSAGITVTDAAAPAAASGTGSLPATGGSVPAAALWLGVGAIGIGGIAVAATAARRRSVSSR